MSAADECVDESIYPQPGRTWRFMHNTMQADQLLSLKQHFQQSVHGLQSHVEAVIHSQGFQDFVQMALQQWVAAASCVACLALLLATIAAGWVALWHTTMKDVGFFREIMGLNKPKPAVKAQMQAERAAEIERIKRQHSRSGLRSRAA